MVSAALLIAAQVPAQTEKSHKVVIQVSSDDPATHRIALNNAVNLQQALGRGRVDIEIVAYGPGLSIMIAGGPESSRIPELAGREIRFSACGNTRSRMEERTGKPLELVSGVRVVPAGVTRILELQEQGYTYLRP
ncbi:MAG: hypothetical protein DWQ08_11015 [Proteobacteria bacterium]|nr:MAG: hypothetical protein DWQ08_11015 [Pseudomonadota bacterium]